MDFSLIIFIVVVVFFVYRGYKKGLLKSLSRILSLLAGYIASFLYTKQVSIIVESQYHLPGLAVFISVALVLFFGAGIIVSLLFWLIGKSMPEKQSASVASSFGGAGVGLVVGVIVGFTLVWTFAFVRDMSPTTQTQVHALTSPSMIEGLAGRAASTAIGGAMSVVSAKPEVANLSVALIESPVELTQQVKRLTQSNDLKNLFSNVDNQAVLNSGSVEVVQKLPAFQRLVKNPDMQALVKSAGMRSVSANNTAAVETELASQVIDVWGRVQRVKRNPRVQAIFGDPEFQQTIQSDNPLTLFTDARLLELMDIIYSDEAVSGTAEIEINGPQPTTTAVQTKPKEKAKLNRWVDKDGRTHYSNVK